VPSVAGSVGKFSEIGCGEGASRDGRRIKGSIATIHRRAGKVHGARIHSESEPDAPVDPSILIISFLPRERGRDLILRDSKYPRVLDSRENEKVMRGEGGEEKVLLSSCEKTADFPDTSHAEITAVDVIYTTTLSRGGLFL